MATGIATIQLKRRKGHPTILAMGKTPRGQSYLKEMRPLKVTSTKDKDFKKELAEAVKDLLS